MATNNAINTPTPISASNGGTGVSIPTAHTIPVAEGVSAFTFLGPLTNGQVLIGSTGADPVAATLSAGSGIGIAVGAGTITISATGDAPYTEVTGTSQAMVGDNEYTANNAGLVTLTLPTTATIGATIRINWKGAGGWKVAQNASQQIQFSGSATTSGTGGSLASSASGDCVTLKCTTANTGWIVQAAIGNLTVV